MFLHERLFLHEPLFIMFSFWIALFYSILLSFSSISRLSQKFNLDLCHAYTLVFSICLANIRHRSAEEEKKSEKIHTCFLFERSRDCVWNSGAFSRTKVNSLTRVQLSLTRTIVSYFYFLSGITFRFWQSFSSEPCRAYALSAIEQNTSAQSMASVISYKFLSALKRKR